MSRAAHLCQASPFRFEFSANVDVQIVESVTKHIEFLDVLNHCHCLHDVGQLRVSGEGSDIAIGIRVHLFYIFNSVGGAVNHAWAQCAKQFGLQEGSSHSKEAVLIVSVLLGNVQGCGNHTVARFLKFCA